MCLSKHFHKNEEEIFANTRIRQIKNLMTRKQFCFEQPLFRNTSCCLEKIKEEESVADVDIHLHIYVCKTMCCWWCGFLQLNTVGHLVYAIVH